MSLEERVKAIHPELTEIRRDIHQYPEIAFQEVRTQGKIKEVLAQHGITRFKELAKTGLVVDIVADGFSADKKPEKVIALRADIDALAMTEHNHDLPYRSKREGFAHMCGHDGHTACLLGAAVLLHEARNKLGNNAVRLLFQPAEEGSNTPGGAAPMIKEGCLSWSFQPDSKGDDIVNEVYGLHNWPSKQPHSVSAIPGPIMAHVTEWKVTIVGKGGHASAPHLCVDPIVIGSQLVVALQTVVSRSLSALHCGVVSVTKFHSGETRNVIPESAVLEGTIRDLSPQVFGTITQRINSLVDSICSAWGAKGTVEYIEMYPETVNNPEMTDHVKRIATQLGLPFTTENLPLLAAEDFSYYLQRVPGCFFFLGGGNTGLCHSVTFNFNDETIPTAVKVWLRLVEDRLGVKLYD